MRRFVAQSIAWRPSAGGEAVELLEAPSGVVVVAEERKECNAADR